ncbi:MerR family transcriptional regulator [Curtobacterium sp. MCJR17_055]|uniref:transcriptional regulator FtsR n=1 Tax=unclassified Curtobacterium TaxID=257496 RepID=UPI000D92C097|nr:MULTISPECIES: MerR family transcriptional regulator [unclassified Curtobacterium]PYY34203.1 MerR family transcriptional regulator [Curtobacterium sp. MCBD17_029]PYY43132.1 MerR family transcriptional regulator [Curtobacterium sp. MCPF17_046]PYY54054.1 MerR family transcriptional regulator [Curtobacterium sp. MCJR17_055]PYY59061.1 MerR family transcriptional regulator [Curtobacterium sp. MCPF17_015]WIB16728.1 MerR family transcriptional regulator [Curtobacterium sp. MCPF17_050]
MAPRSAAARAVSPAPDLLTIGQVLARLKPDFPDLSSSKLRFLEERELVTPVRTQSGYRKFSPADVDRLRIVLGLQRDHYLPLKVIKEYLADLDAGREPTLPGGGDVPRPSMLGRERRYSRDELQRVAGASPMLVGDAVSSSLLPAADSYGEESVGVLKALVELQRSGIEPRHLRTFRATAEREVGLIESALMPVSRRGDATSRAKALELAREIAGHLEVIRSSLIRAAIGRLDS